MTAITVNNLYLDEAATSKPECDLINQSRIYQTFAWYNPSSLYENGKVVKTMIEAVRKQIADSINAEPCEIYFTSGSTESNNWVFRGFNDYYGINSVIITTPIEHNSILYLIKNKDYALKDSMVCKCKVFEDGHVDSNDLEEKLSAFYLTKSNALVSVIYGNNEIGTIQDIEELSYITHKYNGIFHTDATQAYGKVKIDVKKQNIDLLSASSQKLGGIKGCGFLYIKKDVKIAPLIYGSQENKMRGGTENTLGILTFGKAVEKIDYEKSERISKVRDYMIKKLKTRFDCKINGSLINRLPNNINLTFPQAITGESLIYMLEVDGILLSSGSACNSYSVKPSNVLTAIGLSEDEASRTIRITLADDIELSKVDVVIEAIDKAIKVITS